MTLDRAALKGKVALVTGCGRLDGIGAAISRCLAGAGASIAVVDLPLMSDGLQELASSIDDDGGRAVPLTGDVTSEESCSQILRECGEQLGDVNILVNNAAAPKGDDRGDIANIPLSGWETVININLRGVFLMAKHALPYIRKGGEGRIINIGSLAAMRSFPGRTIYGVSKAGVVGLTVSLAGDLASEGITVNAVCPGLVRTGRNPLRGAQQQTPTTGGPQVGDAYSWAPLYNRIANPEDIAGVVAFLASGLGGYVTGQAIVVDGGLGTVMNLA